MNNNLLASSASLKGIQKLISEFYFSTIESIELIPEELNTWKVVKNKKEMSTKVRLKNKRYRFES